MTLDELLDLARNVHAFAGKARLPATDVVRLAAAVRDLLEESQPCGWPEPECKGPGAIWWESLGSSLTIDEARSIAVMLLRAADEAEAKS